MSGSDVFFAATGITDGSLLRGVRYWPDGATTYSLVMRSRSGTIRWVEAEHRFEKLEGISASTTDPEATSRRKGLRSWLSSAGSLGRKEPSMAEKTIVVCDVCGKPATETVTIKVARGNYAKDLCAAHVTELVAGARRPATGSPAQDGRRGGRAGTARPPAEEVGGQEDSREAIRQEDRPAHASVARVRRRRRRPPSPPDHRAVVDERAKRRLHLPSHVGVGERIEVPATEGQVLDLRPVERPPPR